MNKIITIAELGWNHVGDMDLAKRMIESAAQSGADIVKFQTWKVNRLTPGPWDHDGRRQIYEKAELTEEKHHLLKSHCDQVGIKFMTSVFCKDDLDFVRTLTNEVKIPSPEAGNVELVQAAIDKFDHVYISNGGTTLDEWFRWRQEEKVTLLHCISSYPCEAHNFHVKKLLFLRQHTKHFGFSGHSPTIWDAIMAIGLGAVVVEKHFTLDHDLPGRDNKFALLPDEFKKIREFADLYYQMQTEYEVGDIIECEKDYRKFHKGRWSGGN